MSDPQRCGFVADSAACADHFPGRPIMPGALLLDEILRRLPVGATLPLQVETVKFRRIVPPGTPVELEWQADGAQRTRFALRIGREVAVEGVASAIRESP
jgi:3-hydroxymyristoyl/3-hydroxydecanoyl-(acyl carrier protein) dehydratase